MVLKDVEILVAFLFECACFLFFFVMSCFFLGAVFSPIWDFVQEILWILGEPPIGESNFFC